MAPRLELPAELEPILERLWSAGHAAYVVGGSTRDLLLGRVPLDHDVATDALPERILALFPGSRYENRFGTVTIAGAPMPVQVTTFRRDHRYGDHRRPEEVTFTSDLVEDLQRRDFTINAIAVGREAAGEAIDVVDPSGGRRDLDARLVRAVGDADARFEEDALRLLRAVRLAAEVGFLIEDGTAAAIRRRAELARHLSPERIGAELRRLLMAARPSRGLELLRTTRLLAEVLPELAAQEGVPQNKPIGGDLWRHTVATVDAVAARAPGDERLRLAALLHDVGKPSTHAGGHFYGHEEIGATMSEAVLARLAFPRRQSEFVTRLVREHMFSYDPRSSDAAIRRFIRNVGADLVEALILLREADNIGSGESPDAHGLSDLRRRVRAELERHAPLAVSALAVDGHDLQELGVPPGPALGALLEELLESVVADPSRNTREQLLDDARLLIAKQARATSDETP